MTHPNTPEVWEKIVWSGDDVGKPVRGRPNQRAITRSLSRQLRVTAELGGTTDWVVSVQICGLS